MNALAAAAGLHRQRLYDVASTGRMHPSTADKLRHGLSQLLNDPHLSGW